MVGYVVQRVVDDRVLLLGLDQHYREAMKLFEAKVLLGCAEKVAAQLGVGEANVPLEGYYSEPIPGLARYFRLMRALQEVTEEAGDAVRGTPDLERILQITGSALYGRPQFERNDEMKLLPTGRDPLSQAMFNAKFEPDLWTVPFLAAKAKDCALEYDDISLVGLAARAGDAVVLAALRESVVLYAEKIVTLGGVPEYEYVWRVDPALAVQANRFIELFNRLVASANAPLHEKSWQEFGFRASRPIPSATAASAAHFYDCFEDNEIAGRCVHLGTRLDTKQMYHWAIRIAKGRGGLEAHDFWHDEMWSTARYRGAQA